MLIPCCYFPTTVIFIDDSRKFLENISLAFNGKELRFHRFFDDPVQALEFINTRAENDSFLSKCLLEPEEEPLDRGLINVNTLKLHHEIFNPERFEALSVVVVDQVMPQMAGLDVCRSIKDPSIKKIMLTGEADEHFAIKAFNERIIDRFIRKDSPDLEASLKEAIATLQHQYFLEQYNIALNSLTWRPEKACGLGEPGFIAFFQKLCAEQGIKEYYLLDNSGSFLLVDHMNSLRWLIVKTDEELDHLAEFAEEDEAPENIFKPLRDRTHLIYFYSYLDSCTSPSEWAPFLYPITGRLEGKCTYYYALLDQPRATEFKASRIAYYG